jgi:hypothetical protein
VVTLAGMPLPDIMTTNNYNIINSIARIIYLMLNRVFFARLPDLARQL